MLRFWGCSTTLILLLAAAGAADRRVVQIKNMQFIPATLNIQIGQTVVWTNQDDRDHTVTAADESFNSGNLRPGASFSFTFTKAGTFPYSCSYHPRMKGTVNVSE